MFMNKQAGSVKSALALILALTRRLGIAEVLRETGVEPQSFDQRRWDNGHILLRSPLGQRSRPLSAHLTTPCIAVICIVRWWM